VGSQRLNYGQTTVPPGLTNVTAIAAGYAHTVAIGAVQPTITAQPQSLVVNVTSNAAFSVTALGATPFSYQWRKNGANVTGATSASLTLTNVQTNQAGNYTVVITNAYGSVTSSVAVLTVNRLAQTINFVGGLPARRVDDAPFGLSATASSGLPVSYTSSCPGVATVSGNTVTITGFGNTIITASQAGNTTYLPADSVSQTLHVAMAGTVVAWGQNNYGQTNVPAGLSGVMAIDAGFFHTVALKTNGAVVAWGRNAYGETNVPAGLTNVTAIAAGGDHTVALKSDGTVVAWGRNSEGQTNVPTGLNNVTAIAAGALHTVALKSDGTVVGWGYNVYGETTAPAGLSNVTAIAAGEHHTVALKTNGTVVAWGQNNYGQTNVPAGLSAATAIAAGAYHTVALVGTAPQPRLTIIRSGANVILTWPTDAAGFTLQSTTNLVPPAVWSTNSPAPVVVNGQNAVTNPVSGTKKFYRLSQ
jgi:hypothetical protein